MIEFIRRLLFGHGIIDMAKCPRCGNQMRLLEIRERDVPILGGLIIVTRGERAYECGSCKRA
jgi:C4-type Zn-finger protein